MSHALQRLNIKPHKKGVRERSFKAFIDLVIVCPLGDRHRESGRNRRFSAGISTPESLSRAAEHKMHGCLPVKGLRTRRSDRHRGRPGAEIPGCRPGRPAFFESGLRTLISLFRPGAPRVWGKFRGLFDALSGNQAFAWAIARQRPLGTPVYDFGIRKNTFPAGTDSMRDHWIFVGLEPMWHFSQLSTFSTCG